MYCRLIPLLQPKINCETKAGQDHPEYEKFCEAYNLSHGNGTAGTITDPFYVFNCCQRDSVPSSRLQVLGQR